MNSVRTRTCAVAATFALTFAGALTLPANANAPRSAAATTAPAATSAPAARAAAAPRWKARPAQYPSTTTVKDLAIPMSDGTILRGDLIRPVTASGAVVKKKLPVIVTITAYNKTVMAGGSMGLGGADASYLVKRGYLQLTVDARGTGSSEGIWQAFAKRENKDAGEVMNWAHRQSWSNGRTGMSGPSYMGISQLWAASARPKGLKAIFPQVPAADVYRDVVASGGQIDVGFMPLWMGLVTATGVIPPAVTASDPRSGVVALLSHLSGALTFTTPMLVTALLGGEPAFDGPFYRERSPIEVLKKINVPTFLVGGEFDLFQRGTPLVFENLRKRGVPVRMIYGPWDHLQGSSGADVVKAGHGSISELQLRWFDRYVKGRKDRRLDKEIPPLTWYEQGTGRWRSGSQWIGKRHKAVSFSLSGSAANMKPGGLTRGKARSGTASVYPIPVAGLCTRSMNQWTAGLPKLSGLANPCLENNALNDAAGVTFDSAPLRKPLSFQGPLNARIYASSITGDGMLSIAVEDVAPNGTVTRLTGGWQVLSHRALDRKRTRFLDGQILQPYHPFTKAAKKPLGANQVGAIDVEIFPTGARIKKGHRLRIAVQAFDIPHLLPTIPDLPGTLTVLTVHNSAKYRSRLTLPVIK
ncbi:CocE/NonD family hydrolase [Nocardioides sp. Bht2]|uniref:CocE/NonD family hydrolase n=1 Tax=Nocardioides sp. Bht2 TaxID=3392297 RepID=UPI0039B6BB80